MSTMLAIVLVLFVLILIVSIVRNSMFYNDYDDEVTTTTTTTVTTDVGVGVAQPTGLNINGIAIVGMLVRQFENGQPFVIDPVDNDKMYLNTKDDIYEDGAGKVWGLQ